MTPYRSRPVRMFGRDESLRWDATVRGEKYSCVDVFFALYLLIWLMAATS